MRVSRLCPVILLLALVFLITLAGTGCDVAKSGGTPGTRPGAPNPGSSTSSTSNPGKSTPATSDSTNPTWSTAPGAVKVILPDNVVSSMKSTVLNFLYSHIEPRNSVMHYEIRSLHITIQGETRHNNQVEMDFLVGYEHRLDIARPEDAPVIKGMIAYLNDNRNSLSPQGIKVINGLIATWKSQISSYMNTYIPGNELYVEKAQVDNNNNLVPGTSKLYAEVDYKPGGLLPADVADKTPTDQEVEQQSYDAAKMAVERAAATGNGK